MPFWRPILELPTTIISSICAVTIISPRTRTLVTAPTFYSFLLVYSNSYWPHVISTEAIAFFVYCRCFHSLWQLSSKFRVSIQPLPIYLSSPDIFHNLNQITSLFCLQYAKASHFTKSLSQSHYILQCPI